MTEKGLVMRDHLGGGLVIEMDPQDVVRNVKLYSVWLCYTREEFVSYLYILVKQCLDYY